MTHTPLNKVCKRVAEMNAENYGEDSPGGCTREQEDVLRVIKKLRSQGIEWTDFHAGNFGYDKNGKFKVLDLGVTKTQLEHEPEILEGRQAAARRQLSLIPGLVTE